jgi:uncharacterized protein YkwD
MTTTTSHTTPDTRLIARSGAAEGERVAGLTAALGLASHASSYASTPLDGYDRARERAAVHYWIGRHRAAAGRAQLERSWPLKRAARAHSLLLVRTGAFRHAELAAGGETLFWATAATPRATVRAWLDSPPHRAVLLSPELRHVGLGIAPGTPAGVPGVTFLGAWGGGLRPVTPRQVWHMVRRLPSRRSATATRAATQAPQSPS